MTVVGRAAFEDICDKAVVSHEADLGEELVEQLPRPPDERLSLLILVEAGRLADEHQVRVGVPVPEDDRRPTVRERALPAVLELAVELDEALTAGGRRTCLSGSHRLPRSIRRRRPPARSTRPMRARWQRRSTSGPRKPT